VTETNPYRSSDVGLDRDPTGPRITLLVLAGVTPELAGTASAVFNTFRQVGGAVAIAIFGALIADRTQFTTGMQTSLTIAAALLLATVAISVRIRPTGHT
jgi:DHA2 family methylenomycin A resistance protein-like MFS transporter